MRFTPRTEEELKKVWEKGEYDFTVRAASDEKPTAKGGEMLTVQIEIHHPQRPSILLTDYLGDFMPGKFRNFAYGIGLGDQYEAGELEPDWCIRRDGRVRIGVEVDKKGEYPDKNKVLDYIVGSPAPAQSQAPAQAPSSDLQKRAAWAAFKVKFRTLDPETMKNRFGEAVQSFFKKPPNSVSESEWAKFTATGFTKPAMANPIPDEPVYAEDDIPF